MLSEKIKSEVNHLKESDKALLVEYILESLCQNEDKDILDKWIQESERRLDAVNEGKLDLVDYDDIRKELL